jgi:hypothetical protein
MMNTMKFANMEEYLDKSSSEVIISKITRGKSFHPTHIDLLKKEIDGYLKLTEHFRDYMAFTSVYGEVQQELLNNEEANEIREKKYFGMPLFLFRVIVSLIVGVYIVMVGTEYRPYLSWTDCNLKVEVDPG